MSHPALGLCMLGLSVVAIMLGFPTAFTLMGLGMIFGFVAFWTPDQPWYDNHVFDLMVQRTYGVMNNDTLLSVPLFVFMGYIMERAALVDRMFHSVQLAFRRVPASLAVTTLLVCAFWGIASGIVGAVVVLMGVIAMRPMLRAGYDVRLASGAITAGGTLGILIPPSVMLIVYAAVAGVSIVKLYAAAMLPGFFLTLLYLLYILGWAILDPKIAPKLSESEYRVAVPSWLARFERRPGGNVLGGLFGALFSKRRERDKGAPGPGAIARALGVASVPLALTLLTFAGSFWYIAIHSAAPVATNAGAVQAEAPRLEAPPVEPDMPEELGLADLAKPAPAADPEPQQPEELGIAPEQTEADAPEELGLASEAAAPGEPDVPEELGIASDVVGAEDPELQEELGLASSNELAALGVEPAEPEELGIAEVARDGEAQAPREAAPEELGSLASADARPAGSIAAVRASPPRSGLGRVPESFYTWFWVVAVAAGLLLALYYASLSGERLQILRELVVSVLPLGVLTIVVLAVILFGITTATESAAIGALSALYLAVMSRHPRETWRWSLVGALVGAVIGLLRGEPLIILVAVALGGVFGGAIGPWRQGLKKSRALWQLLKEPTFLTAKTTAMVCWLFVGSALFSAVFALHGGQALIERWVLGMDLSPVGFLALAQLLIFLLGWPLEWTEIIVIFCPIFIPLLGHFQVDPILFGTMVAVNLQAAFLSPPVAMSAFYLKGVSPPHVQLRQIFAGMTPYMLIVLLCLVFMYLWPGMSLWLPEFLYGP